jgi:PKHD-type hydroxylase
MEKEPTYMYMNQNSAEEYTRSARVFPIKCHPKNNWDFTITEGFLSTEECRSIIDWCNAQELTYATVYSDEENKPSLGYRCVKECTVDQNQFAWLYDRLANEIPIINDIQYGYDLVGMFEPIGFLKYKDFSDELGPQDSTGKYDWHRDTSGDALLHRKISTIIQLNDGYEYKGCELQVHSGFNPVACEAKKAGSLITFPSWRNHRVTEITAGIRYSLVCWISGPQFR